MNVFNSSIEKKKNNISTTCPSNVLLNYQDVDYPSVTKVTYHSTTTNSTRPLNIVLPIGYSNNKKYPVLYLLHGLFCDEDTMVDEDLGLITISTNLMDDKRIREFIIVCPYEYAPVEGQAVPASFSQKHFDGYDNFIHDLINDIMPYMAENYSVASGKENTAIAGFSMGGRNSLYIGYQRPDLFGYIGAFSPAPGVTPGKDAHLIFKGLISEEEFRASSPLLLSLICCGTNDSIVHSFPKQYHNILTRNQQEHIWFEIPNVDHDYKAVRVGFYNFILAAFGITE